MKLGQQIQMWPIDSRQSHYWGLLIWTLNGIPILHLVKVSSSMIAIADIIFLLFSGLE